MISRFTCFAFVALVLSAHALPSRLQQEPKPESSAIATVYHTVTVTAEPPLQTPSKGGDKESSGSNGKKSDKGNTKASERSKSTSAGDDKNKTDGKPGGGKENGGRANENNGGNKNDGRGDKKNNNNDPQKSLTLDPRVIGKGFANDGQDQPSPGQVRSLTSTNNFINFCLNDPKLPVTNGKQISSGSCNPVPIGLIPSVDHMPSSKFVFPKNFDTIKAGQTFTIEMTIKNMETGFFVNAQANYFAAPQQLNKGGQIQGHSHVVIEKLDSLDQTRPTDPKKFAFFKGLNAAAKNGKLTATVDKGLQPGVYRMSSINTSSNHQPVLVPIAQHGFLDDAIYFTVTADGKPRKKSK